MLERSLSPFLKPANNLVLFAGVVTVCLATIILLLHVHITVMRSFELISVSKVKSF